MKFMTRLTFVGLSLILSVCLLASPALAELGMKNLTGLWLFDEGSATLPQIPQIAGLTPR